MWCAFKSNIHSKFNCILAASFRMAFASLLRTNIVYSKCAIRRNPYETAMYKSQILVLWYKSEPLAEHVWFHKQICRTVSSHIKYDLDRSCTHPKFEPTGVQTQDIQIMDSTFYVPEPLGTSLFSKRNLPLLYLIGVRWTWAFRWTVLSAWRRTMEAPNKNKT